MSLLIYCCYNKTWRKGEAQMYWNESHLSEITMLCCQMLRNAALSLYEIEVFIQAVNVVILYIIDILSVTCLYCILNYWNCNCFNEISGINQFLGILLYYVYQWNIDYGHVLVASMQRGCVCNWDRQKKQHYVWFFII